MLHIRKLCVGVRTAQDLIDFQKQRLKMGGRLLHRTRNTPKRQEEILQGGSLYWIIAGKFSLRQKIIGFETESAEEVVINDPSKPAKPHCLFILDKKLQPVVSRSHHGFQGWRYLQDKDKPPDISKAGKADDIDPDLVEELRNIGIVI